MAKERPDPGKDRSDERDAGSTRDVHPREADRGDDRDDDSLRCRVCDHRISERGYRTERGGAHEHTFVNPGGFMHHIGCFVAAPGCVYIGPTEQAFSWFPGWAWQVAVCARCKTHVGWIFRLAGEQFHALLLAALRP